MVKKSDHTKTNVVTNSTKVADFSPTKTSLAVAAVAAISLVILAVIALIQ